MLKKVQRLDVFLSDIYEEFYAMQLNLKASEKLLKTLAKDKQSKRLVKRYFKGKVECPG